MHSQSSTVGCCPRCDSTITADRVLIRYRRAGREAMYATCPACADVVRPERPD